MIDTPDYLHEGSSEMINDRIDTNDLIAWLETDEAESRHHRAERLRLLLGEYGEEGGIQLFPGGLVSRMAFEEARLAYLHGVFLGCIMLCQVCVEHMLAGLFRMAGRNDLNRAAYQTLLEEAREQQFLSEDEFDLFDRLKALRNPYVHPRAPTAQGSVIRRAMDTDTPFEDMVVVDAELAITALLRLCRRPPFSLPLDHPLDQ